MLFGEIDRLLLDFGFILFLFIKIQRSLFPTIKMNRIHVLIQTDSFPNPLEQMDIFRINLLLTFYYCSNESFGFFII